jgi:hypothetical protein
LFFPDRCFLPNDTDLLYVGTNIFLRNEKKMMYEKLRVEKVQLNCLFMRKDRQEKKMDNAKKNHKLTTTTPPLHSDAMSSDDSKDKQNNATTKLGGQGFLSEDDYQSRRESSQGKQDHS